MAKNRAQKIKKKRQIKKPQKLPISVQALLKYLGGTNVSVGGSGSRQAVIAPQFPMPQQQVPVPPLQSQSQPEQATPRRRRTVGTVIASSPLAQLAPPPQLPQQIQPRQPDEKLIAKETVKRQAKEKERQLATSRVEKLEGQLGSFTEKANIVVSNIRSLEKTFRQRFSNDDEDLLDNEIPADARPLLDEPVLNVALTKAPAIARSSSVPIMRTIELEPEQGSFMSKEYISKVSNPEMTKQVKLKGKPGRKPLSEAERDARKAAKKSAGESFLAEGPSIASSVEALTASMTPRGKTPKTPRAKGGAASLQKLQGLDPSTQIQALTAQSQGGGGVAKRGVSIIDLLKSTAKPQ